MSHAVVPGFRADVEPISHAATGRLSIDSADGPGHDAGMTTRDDF